MIVNYSVYNTVTIMNSIISIGGTLPTFITIWVRITRNIGRITTYSFNCNIANKCDKFTEVVNKLKLYCCCLNIPIIQSFGKQKRSQNNNGIIWLLLLSLLLLRFSISKIHLVLVLIAVNLWDSWCVPAAACCVWEVWASSSERRCTGRE